MHEIIVVSMFLALVIGLMVGHPIGFVLGGVAVWSGLFGWGTYAFDVMVTQVYGVMDNYLLIAIPMFVLMANFLMHSTVADGLFESVRHLFGTVHGGLAVTVVIVSTVFAATTGVVGASVVTMGLLGLPVLEKYNYDHGLAAGVVCAGGSLGILIPPSIMLVTMATMAQLSVGRLFLAAFLPGLFLSLCYTIYILVVCKRRPELGPAMTVEEAAEMSTKEKITGCLVNLVPPLILIVGVLGTIFTGVATPTEASAMGAFIALIMTFFYKKFSFKMLKQSVIDTAQTSAMVFVIMIAANSFTAVFLSLRGAQMVEAFVAAVGLGKWAVFGLMSIIVFVLGMFIDWIGIVAIVLPIFLPILDTFGFDRLWVCAATAVLLQTCFMTPPFGYALFYIRGVMPKGFSMKEIYRGVLPFIAIVILVLIVVVVWPELILYLPQAMMGAQ